MGSPAFEQRRSEQRAQVRRSILDATEALLLEEGEERFSIRRLVERCGYTAPTIYHHFGDKTGLIDALLDERFDRLRSPDEARAPRRRLGGVPARDGARVRALRPPESDPSSATVRAARPAACTSALRARGAARCSSRPGRSCGNRDGCVRVTRVPRGRRCSACSTGSSRGASCGPDHDWSKTGIEDGIDALLRGLVAPEPVRNGRRRKER